MKKCSQDALLRRALELTQQSESVSNLHAYIANAESFADNYDTIKKENQGKVVAILDGKVIWVSDDDALKIGKKIRKCPFKSRIYISYVPAEEEAFMV